jgi:hypothetical protein
MMEYDDFELTTSVSQKEWDEMEPYERFVVLFSDNGGFSAKEGIQEAIGIVENYADKYGISDEQKKLMLKNLELAQKIAEFPIIDVKQWLADYQED